MGENTKAISREDQLKKLSVQSKIRAFLPIVGLVVIFIFFNVLTGGQMNGEPGNTNTIKVETIKA